MSLQASLVPATTDEAVQQGLESPAVSRANRLPRLSHEASFRLGRIQAWNDLKTGLPLLASDAICVLGVTFIAATIDMLTGHRIHPAFAVGTVLLTLLMQYAHGLYPACGWNYSQEFRAILKTTMIVSLAVGFGLLMQNELYRFPWQCWMVFSGLLGLSLLASRPMVRKFLARFDWWAQPVVILGAGKASYELSRRMNSCRNEGLRSLGIVFDPSCYWNEPGSDRDLDQRERRLVGTLGDLQRILLEAPVCRVAVPQNHSLERMDFHDFHGIPHVMLASATENHPTASTRLHESDGALQLHCRYPLTCPCSLALKRTLDLVLVIGTLPMWLPLMVMVGLAIKISDPGPIFYRQARIGRFRRPFQALKFRSMVCQADRKLREYLDAHPEMKAEWESTHKLQNDPRVTWIGNFLRRTSLDELPQLLNVLIGDMSLVGPRPIIDSSDYDAEYIHEHPEVFELYQMVRPGITGLWQISGRNSLSYKQRIFHDRNYLNNWSIALDIFILWRTVKTALLREGAC